LINPKYTEKRTKPDGTENARITKKRRSKNVRREGRTEGIMIKTFKLSIFLFSLIVLFSGISNAQKVLSEGFNSKVDQPFVFVARDQIAYTQLQNLVDGLPLVSNIDFAQNVVVAGFAGTRPTGGWTVEINKSGGRVDVNFRGPGKDMMVTQMITTPFKVSVISIEGNKGLFLNLPQTLTNKIRTFQVNKGDFEYTGGIAGRRKQFKANGTIRLFTYGDYATVWFDLRGKGQDRRRSLSDISSGTLKNGQLALPRLDAGSFIEFPHPPFGVVGTLKNKTLSLNFKSLPTSFADGYEGWGSLEAVRIK
jgi:hypothetical protein